MGYYDDMKQVRKELRSEMLKAGIKNISIKGGKGSAYDWTDITPAKVSKRGYYEWGEDDLKKLKKFLGKDHVQRSGEVMRSHDVEATLHGYRARGFKKKAKYKKFVSDFEECGLKEADSGTCVLGAGTIVKKKGKPIDVIRQLGQSEHRNYVAMKIMEERAKKLGLELEHEGGTMD